MQRDDLLAKVKTQADLVRILGQGPRPSDQQVVMCHGVFDVVHPGHIRHLMYAKTKAPILVASITADQHIDKGHYRPHVPQDLRALNLAALQFVDYVLVDHNATPLENISVLRPDFFAKGYEYREGVAKTEAEAEALKAYGGEIIFTPGDVVYSSSRIIDAAPPALGMEKLLAVMDREGISFGLLREVIHRMKGQPVHVVGDTIVDSYTYTAMIGGSTKTPTLSVLHEKREDYLGGAGVVARHLRAAGAEVRLSTVLGDDAMARFAVEQLQRDGIQCLAIQDRTRPTTHKNVFICGGHRLLKVDTVDNRTISDEAVGRLRASIERTTHGAVVFSDFRHGIFNRRTIPELVAAIRAPVRVADSQVSTRWGNILDFKGFDLITPNEREARFALGDQDSGIRMLASALHAAAGCQALIMKLGERGIVACMGDGKETTEDFVALDSFADRVVDGVGAGDALLAYATLARQVSGEVAIAAVLGSLAAALECEAEGNVPVTPEAMLERLARLQRAAGGGS